jgi:hypothetical protein
MVARSLQNALMLAEAVLQNALMLVPQRRVMEAARAADNPTVERREDVLRNAQMLA